MMFPFLIPIVAIICGTLIALGLPLIRAFAKRAENAPLGVPAELQARLSRMEQAIDSIAVEVERISEGQRFTTKLLAERSADTPRLEPSRPMQEQRP